MLVLAGVPGRLNCYRGELTGTSVRLPFLNQRQLLGRRGAANVMSGETWRSNIVSDPAEAVQIAGAAKLVGVLGIAPESKADRPAHFVAKAVQASGARVIPVPVYYPDVTNILGEQVYRKVADIPGRPLDVLDVFRRPEDLSSHLEDILMAQPKVVWLQSGISEPAFEEALARRGIRVVADRCLKVDRAHALSRL